MTTNQKTPDITVRGGLINVPLSNKSPLAGRHQPNTPINKKKTVQKSDHQPVANEQKPTTTEPKIPAAAPPEPPPTEQKEDKNHVPTETSQSD